MTSVRDANLGGAIVATLKERIIAWQYPPEHRLTEEGLCQEFGVSRSPVREALRVLVNNGFVRRTPTRGYAVKQVNLREIEELYAVRLALELFVVENLAERGVPPEALAAIKRPWDAIRRDPNRKGEEMAEFDARFHESLSELFGNATLLQHLKAINERLFVVRMIDFGKPHRVENTCAQHLRILARIAARDSAGARKAMLRNIEDGRAIVRAAIGDALARAHAI
jgi:DNA-binding GntR family transcriptional regulator